MLNIKNSNKNSAQIKELLSDSLINYVEYKKNISKKELLKLQKDAISVKNFENVSITTVKDTIKPLKT